jgi:hypothetical protein
MVCSGYQREKGKIMCEDYPCCGHEYGDCNGQKYGSDESIKEREYARMAREDEGYYDWDGE